MVDERAVSLLSKEDQAILGELDEGNISSKVQRHATHPCNLGHMKNPDGQAALTGICEDTVLIQLHIKDAFIDDICFQTTGCGFTLACGSVATEMVRGKKLSYALGITAKKIDRALEGLPKEHTHCADLTANTVKAAAKNALDNIKEPWKRMYYS